jgi:hypothetical protein
LVVYKVVGAGGVGEGYVEVDPFGDATAAVAGRHQQPSYFVASPAVVHKIIEHTVVEVHSQTNRKDQR